jgi:hypothetical protein
VSYLFSAVLFYTTYNIYTFAPSQRNFIIFQLSDIIYLVTNFVSNLLLAQIFWNLGLKKEETAASERNTEAGHMVTIEVENFDEVDEFHV